MSIINHPTLGEIILTKSKTTRQITARVNLSGQLKITCPQFYPDRGLKRFIKTHQTDLAKLLDGYRQVNFYNHGDLIGKTCQIKLVPSGNEQPQAYQRNNYLIVELKPPTTIDQPHVQSLIREQVKKILRKQAKDYLPQRLDFLAKKHHFNYARLRLPHTSTRWGSCSSRGTISLNIALMNLPTEMIDYVIIHELTHTQELNHSSAFWQTVADIMPDYQRYEKQLKAFSPHI